MKGIYELDQNDIQRAIADHIYASAPKTFRTSKIEFTITPLPDGGHAIAATVTGETVREVK